MTTKQILLAALILGATSSIAMGMNNRDPYGYPQSPQQCDICKLDIEQYQKEYRRATIHFLNDVQGETNNSLHEYPKKTNYVTAMLKILYEIDLRNDLSYIKKQQELCPTQRNKKIKKAAKIGFNQ